MRDAPYRTTESNLGNSDVMTLFCVESVSAGISSSAGVRTLLIETNFALGKGAQWVKLIYLMGSLGPRGNEKS
jgi:hypothetical protein